MQFNFVHFRAVRVQVYCNACRPVAVPVVVIVPDLHHRYFRLVVAFRRLEFELLLEDQLAKIKRVRDRVACHIGCGIRSYRLDVAFRYLKFIHGVDDGLPVLLLLQVLPCVGPTCLIGSQSHNRVFNIREFTVGEQLHLDSLRTLVGSVVAVVPNLLNAHFGRVNFVCVRQCGNDTICRSSRCQGVLFMVEEVAFLPGVADETLALRIDRRKVLHHSRPAIGLIECLGTRCILYKFTIFVGVACGQCYGQANRAYTVAVLIIVPDLLYSLLNRKHRILDEQNSAVIDRGTTGHVSILIDAEGSIYGDVVSFRSYCLVQYVLSPCQKPFNHVGLILFRNPLFNDLVINSVDRNIGLLVTLNFVLVKLPQDLDGRTRQFLAVRDVNLAHFNASLVVFNQQNFVSVFIRGG